MATSLDQTLGMGLVTLAGVIFTYYTVWVILMPFADNDNMIQQFFLPRIYAIIIPFIAGLALLTFLGVFITIVMVKKKKTK
ncbi:dolichol phosphate-mannose biosynthesis regulatory protein-like [Asterias rubens]|uniref:dolichol phosphate-mannose biosynthesis regulatory protein-like n=1 Tax=Asterias rubens TaxID=7604 RepID=UPI001455C907|nr:dolichol phosphate-mannose biosynthesis regulatory protein-like [Asterias rubens]